MALDQVYFVIVTSKWQKNSSFLFSFGLMCLLCDKIMSLMKRLKMTNIKKTLKNKGLMPGSSKAQEMHFVGFLSACVVLAAVILS